jgi:hypothetical protein
VSSTSTEIDRVDTEPSKDEEDEGNEDDESSILKVTW